MRSAITPNNTRSRPKGEVSSNPREQSENELLRRRVDDLAQQILQARDAVLGAEAELGVARARVVELEHQVHVRDVEIEELRAALARTGRRGRAVDAGVAAGDELARGAVRLARSVARGSRSPRS